VGLTTLHHKNKKIKKIGLVQDRNRRRALVNSVCEFGIETSGSMKC
jgi:hypothetical protein